MITISGTATQQDGSSNPQPASGVAVAAYKSSDETTPVAMTTTDAQGNYSLTIATNGQALDGFLKATSSGNVDTYLYPPAPLTADFSNAPIEVVATFLYNALAGDGNTGGKQVLALEVVDTSFQPIAGASVTSTPAAPKTGYTGSGLLPDTTATQTAADGRAFMFGLAAGQVMVSATKTGLTFKSHSVNLHANALTTTVITE